jgi:hypothetical protein
MKYDLGEKIELQGSLGSSLRSSLWGSLNNSLRGSLWGSISTITSNHKPKGNP